MRRSPWDLFALVMYSVSAVFISVVITRRLEPELWNAIFWIILLFAGIQISYRGVSGEAGENRLYHYQLFEAVPYFTGRFLINLLLLVFIAAIQFLVLFFMEGSPVVDHSAFILVVIAGSTGLAWTLTFTGALSIHSDQGGLIMALLSFPVIIPVLILCVRMTAKTFMDSPLVSYDEWPLLAGALLLQGAVGLGLFNYLWRD